MASNRQIEIETPLGPDVLLVSGFSAFEAISQPFHFDLDLISEKDSIDLTQLLGARATVRVRISEGKWRSWNGRISRISQGPRGSVFTSYRAELVPWLWFLGLKTDSRIFQDSTTPQILSKVFADLGFDEFRLQLDDDFKEREYCVQYRETDLNFVSRLMEEEGLFYFFEHHDSRHILVIGNKPDVHLPCQEVSDVYFDPSRESWRHKNVVSDWNYKQHYIPSSVALTDFDYLRSSTNLPVSLSGKDIFEVYEHPGKYQDQDRGQQLAEIRLQENQAQALIIQGDSTCRTLASGYRFALHDHYREEWNTDYVLMEVRHHGTNGADRSVGDAGAMDDGDNTFRSDFYCLPHSTPFRPLRRTLTPVVDGCQTATVVGPPGEEIHTDEYGRVKVQFHWDRKGSKNQKSSCWIRVAQSLAGDRWGLIAIPRIGQEVVIDFLEGNPDQPIIIGCVYNGLLKPPYPLPENKDMVGLRSNSTKGGSGYSEFVIKDTKGSELIRLHAERDVESIIGRNDKLHVMGDIDTQVDGKHHESVKGEIQIQSTEALIRVEASTKLTLKVGESSLFMDDKGFIMLKGKHVVIVGTDMVDINPD